MTAYQDIPPLQCHQCFHSGEPDLGWQTFANGTVHLRAECRKCAAWIQYLPQTAEDGGPTVWVLAAPTPPAPPAQLL